MFECHVELTLPLAYSSKPEQTPVYFVIAKYTFDPGLKIGDEANVRNWHVGDFTDAPFSGRVGVTKRIKEIFPEKGKEDRFRLRIILEVLDKEDLPRVCAIFKEQYHCENGDKLVDPSPSPSTQD